MLGIAFELDRAPFPGPHMHSAAGRALGAAAGVPGRHAGYLVFGLHQVGNQPLDVIGGAAGEGNGPGA